VAVTANTSQLDREHDALGHLRVVEVSRGLMGGYCGRLFHDQGAQLRRVDASAGATLHGEPPLLEGESLLVSYLHDGKAGLDLDAEAADFHERLDVILEETDVLIEDSWPGELFAGSHAPDALIARHPGLVVISLSPFGRTGPNSHWTGGELCGQAFGALSYITGQTEQPPLKIAGNTYQFGAGVHGFTGGLAALQARRRDGVGRAVDVSLAECVASKQEYIYLYTSMGLVNQRCPAPETFVFPYINVPCADGFLEVGTSVYGGARAQADMATFLNDEEFGKDPRFTNFKECYLNLRAMDERIRAGIRDRKRDELFDLATSLGMITGPVSTPEEVPEIEQLEARAYWRHVKLPSKGRVKLPGCPLRPRTHPRVREHSDAGRPKHALQMNGEMRRPLEGVRVIDFTLVWAGPMATRVLSELGADVIRIASLEYLWRGLEFSTWPENDPGDEPWNRQSYYLEKFLGKRELALEVTQPRGREILEELLAISDIFIENHSPRALAKMGLTYPELAEKFPHLIMTSVSGFGQDGPWGPRMATGDVLEALSSLSYCTGYPGGDPERAGNTVVDALSGAAAAAAMLTALEYRAEHGHGLYLDQAMLESAVAMFPEAAIAGATGATLPVRDGSRHPSRAPHDFYPCRGDDEWIAIDVDSERAWQGLAHVLERPGWLEDARFETAASRVAHREALDALLSEVTAGWEKAALAETLQRAGVSAAPAHDLREIVFDPHLKARGLIQKVLHPDIGRRVWTRNFPGLIDGFDLSIPRAAPLLGEHNEEILGGLLGLSAEEIAQLEREGITGRVPGPQAPIDVLDPERYLEYEGIRTFDPDYRARLGLDED